MPFNAAWKTDVQDLSGHHGFPNARSAAWWMLREILDPESNFEACLPDDTALTGDLTAPQYRWGSGGQIIVEGKEEIRKRLGRSPDSADAVIHALTGAYFYDERKRMAAEKNPTVQVSYRPIKIR